MPKKREIKETKRYKKYKCAKCWQWKLEIEFFKWKNGWKKRIHSYCKECERNRNSKRAKEEVRRRIIKRYKQSLKWLLRQVIDDILYKRKWEEAEKFRKTREILIKLNERDKEKAKKYKKDFLLNIMWMKESIWNWLYEDWELPELDVIEFILENKKRWQRKQLKEQLEERRQELKVGM